MRIWKDSRTMQTGLLIALTLLSIVGFLWVSAQTYGLGFPLDDAWIHQTYARNLIDRGEYAFVPGIPSAGSTSPLWTGILAIGNWLGLDSKLWSYLLGGLLLATIAWVCGRWLALRCNISSIWSLCISLIVIIEWHLVWSAVSGMEILALSLLIVLVLSWLDSSNWNAIGVGALIGLGVWIRPDALSLLLAVAWHVIFSGRQLRTIAARLAAVGVGTGFLFIPYLAFNRVLAGAWWPNTFYAKQMEYAIYREIPLLSRLVKQIGLPLVGVGAVLVPGLILIVGSATRSKSWPRLAPLVWSLAYLGVYAVQLPVSYQHGRYAMPVIPAMLVVGIEGLSMWVNPLATSTLRRFISRVWVSLVPVIAITFWILGCRAYAQDVAIIETEMVAAAKWVSVHTEVDAVVAAHDIGALGYFGERQLLDMAGLVSPEVIPIVRDETRLSTFLDSNGAEYLMTFPSWYPQLVQQAQLIFTTEGPFSPEAGGENMMVYRWRLEEVAP
jgi:hypothetical protein